MIKVCPVCRTDFKTRISKQIYCGKKCYGVWKSKNIFGNKHPSWTGGRIEKNCLTCGVKFESNKCSGRKFCSDRCYIKSRKGKSTGRFNRAEIVCGICGVKFQVKKSEIKKGGGKFCSIKCAAISRRERKGEFSTGWKGGKTKNTVRLRTCFEYAEWRRKVFQRDAFKCQKCGESKGAYLHAHHIEKFSSIMGKIMQSTVGDEDVFEISIKTPELWDVSNGVTLCKKCHKKEHHD